MKTDLLLKFLCFVGGPEASEYFEAVNTTTGLVLCIPGSWGKISEK